jgi:hypothetical protein
MVLVSAGSASRGAALLSICLLFLEILQLSTISRNVISRRWGMLSFRFRRGHLRCKLVDEVADLPFKPELLLKEVILNVHE